MTRVLDIDLLNPANPLTPSFQPSLALVWAGDRVLGTTELPPILPGCAEEARASLFSKFATQLLAASALPAPSNAVAKAPRDLTIVVCTRDRPRLLHQCLHSLAELNPLPAEVVVVDRGTTTDATAQVAGAAARLVAAPGAGWAAARNRGWTAARTDLVAFVGDDVRAHSSYASAVAGAFLAPEVGGVLGLVVPAELNTRPQRLVEVLSGLNRGYVRQVHGPGSWSAALRLDRRGTGADMAFRRSVLGDLGGFDETFDHPLGGPASRSGGDLDLLLHVLRAGGSVVYEPDAVVRRTSARDWLGLSREMSDNGASYAALLAKLERGPGEVAAAARRERRRWHRRDHLRALVGALARRRPWTAAVLLAEVSGSRRGRYAAAAPTQVGA